MSPQVLGSVFGHILAYWPSLFSNDVAKQRQEEFFWFVFRCCSGFSGAASEAGALTVDLEAARQAFDQLMDVSWIKESLLVSGFITIIVIIIIIVSIRLRCHSPSWPQF